MRSRHVAGVMVALALVGSGAGLALVSFAAANGLVHPPRDRTVGTPAVVGLAFDAATLVTKDGLHLAAWWIPAAADATAANARAPTVVFLHGYGASKVQSLGVAPWLHAAGYNVLAFDFRAHGESEGAYTTVGMDEVQDVAAALSWLRDANGVNASRVATAGAHAEEQDARAAPRVALFGWSMGAATALNAARGELGVSAMVLDSPFATLDEVAARMLHTTTGLPAFPFAPLSFAWASWMVHRQVSDDRPIDQARSLNVPLLIIQGLRDSLVPNEDARRLHQAAGKSELWLVPEADHVDSLRADPQGYEQHVLAFLASSFH